MRKLVGTMFALSLSLTGTALAQDIKIGAAGPMTGGEAAFGTQLKAGAEAAVADINAKGGVLGKKLSLTIGDDACDPKQAASVAQKMVAEKVVFVAGHFCSSSSIPASKFYGESGIMQITPASTNPKFTDEGGWHTFRTCGRDDQQGAVAGKYLATTYKGKKVAILHDKTTYGKGLADETKKAANAAGLTEAMYEAYTKGDKDFTALVSKMKQANVEAVYVGGYHNEAGLILKQMRDQGMKAQLISGDALVTEEFWSITGPAGAGTIMTFPPKVEGLQQNKAIVDGLKAAKKPVEGYVLYMYAAIQVWAQAAEKAKTTEGKKVAEALRAGEWDTVVGKIKFDAKGDVVSDKNYVWYVWKDGKYDQM
ncbi:MAG: branched-chain amino acid ABC transporter substrate-binding protein [Hyphomicrobiaceae bacterium]